MTSPLGSVDSGSSSSGLIDYEVFITGTCGLWGLPLGAFGLCGHYYNGLWTMWSSSQGSVDYVVFITGTCGLWDFIIGGWGTLRPSPWMPVDNGAFTMQFCGQWGLFYSPRGLWILSYGGLWTVGSCSLGPVVIRLLHEGLWTSRVMGPFSMGLED